MHAAPTLPKTPPVSERPRAVQAQRQNGEVGDIVGEWDTYQDREMAKGLKPGGIMDYRTTKHLLKNHEEPAIRTAFTAAEREITSGMKRCFVDVRREREMEREEYGIAEIQR